MNQAVAGGAGWDLGSFAVPFLTIDFSGPTGMRWQGGIPEGLESIFVSLVQLL
jgi:hypothetical protein